MLRPPQIVELSYCQELAPPTETPSLGMHRLSVQSSMALEFLPAHLVYSFLPAKFFSSAPLNAPAEIDLPPGDEKEPSFWECVSYYYDKAAALTHHSDCLLEVSESLGRTITFCLFPPTALCAERKTFCPTTVVLQFAGDKGS